MALIIGLSGRKCSGKDSMADYCIDHLETKGYYTAKIGFATELKRQVHTIFGIPYELLYGTDKDKGTLTTTHWEDMPFLHRHRTGPMTVRELLQAWGTDIVRKIDPDSWVIEFASLAMESNADVIFCTDVRFPNEVRTIHELEGKVIRLSRKVCGDSHESETRLDPQQFNWHEFDAVIHNDVMTLEESQLVALCHVKDFLNEREIS